MENKELINQLYTERNLLTCLLANILYKQEHGVSKTRYDSEGKIDDSDGGWFILYFSFNELAKRWDNLEQFSWHLPMKYWDLVNVPLAENEGVAFDGHTKEQAIERLENLVKYVSGRMAIND